MRLILNFLFLLTIFGPCIFGLNINSLTSKHDQRNIYAPLRFCRAQNLNVPVMKSIMNRSYEFVKEGNFIFYEMGSALYVTLTIKLCAGNVYCVCAVKVVNNYDQLETAYMDFCSGISSSNFNLGSIDSIFPPKSEMNCDVLPSTKNKFDVYTKEFWNDRKTTSKNKNGIDCVKVESKATGTYLFKTSNSNDAFDILVEVVVVSVNKIDYVKVFPSANSYSFQIAGFKPFTGGLCGKWVTGNLNPRNCDLYILQNNAEKCIDRGFEQNDEFVNYWRQENFKP